MRSLNLLPIPDAINLEIEYNEELCRSMLGIKVDILEVGNGFAVVRPIQVKNIDGQIYTQKELIDLGKTVMAPAEHLMCNKRDLI